MNIVVGDIRSRIAVGVGGAMTMVQGRAGRGGVARGIRSVLWFAVLMIGGGLLAVGIPNARALPSFARQTGQQCAACHNGFPELTPYGRLFKLNGYTFGGGTSAWPPVAAMVIGSVTHTEADQAGGAAPHFGPNDNFAVDTASLFYGGEILPHLGAFAQVTYDPIGRVLSWDNTDIRYTGTANFLGKETILGVTVNNNPSVTDAWNTTPAWGYPFQASGLAPTPAAATMIEGEFGGLVAGVTAYALWNRLVYVEAGGYGTLSPKTQSALGVNSSSNSSIRGIAPYWRVALQYDWGRNSLEAGMFGMAAAINPMRITGFGTDHAVDIGVDSQYQFLADRDSFSVQASVIFENQSLTASANPAIGAASNSHNTLRSMHLKGTYYYKQTYGATLGVFRVAGTSDATLYANPSNNSPNSTGLISELDFLPFNDGGLSFWPWLNLKLGLQYIYYPEFDGQSGGPAHANNTFYAFTWLAF
jgi:hypothetical protein